MLCDLLLDPFEDIRQLSLTLLMLDKSFILSGNVDDKMATLPATQASNTQDHGELDGLSILLSRATEKTLQSGRVDFGKHISVCVA